MKVDGNQITGLIRQSGDTCEMQEDGTWIAEVKYVCRWLNVVQLAPRRNSSQHPDFSSLKCISCAVVRIKPGLTAELTVRYRGILDASGLGSADTTEEIVSSTSEAPIETHPLFVDELGGTKASPLNGAVFDDNGKFLGFSADSDFAGVESYLIPSTVYRRTTPTTEAPNSIAGVGKISGDVPITTDGDKTWLFSSRTWRRSGGVYDLTEEYALSGDGGWDDIIYGG